MADGKIKTSSKNTGITTGLLIAGSSGGVNWTCSSTLHLRSLGRRNLPHVPVFPTSKKTPVIYPLKLINPCCQMLLLT